MTLRSVRFIKWREVLPRASADFAMVHLSMLLAWAASVIYQSLNGSQAEAQKFITDSTHYYKWFWLLSPVFPVIFFLNGFYTRTRAYLGKYKVLVIFRGVLLSVVLALAITFLLFGSEGVGRSVVLPFAVITSILVCSSRILKDRITNAYDVKPKIEASIKPFPNRVLVVGGAGYIGSLLVERLLQKGHNVRVLDSLVYGNEALRSVRDDPRFELITGDCRNIQDVVKAMRGVESVVDLAAIVGDPACEQDRSSALEVNYAATRMLIEIAKGNGIGRFVFASSCSVYGATEVEVDEISIVKPLSLYAQTKIDSERALLDAATDSFHPTILRFATVFGLSYRNRFDLVVNLLSAKAAQEGVITIYNGQQWRPFIHVRDLVEAIVLTLESPLPLVSGQVLNVGDSRLNHTLTDVAEIIQRVFPNTRVEHVENEDRRNYRVSFQKVQQRLGFRARYSILDGVEEFKKAFEKSIIADYADLRFHNQRFLQKAGSPGHKTNFDAQIMAAFVGPSEKNVQLVTSRSSL